MRGVILALFVLLICAAVAYSFEDLTGFFIRAEPTSVFITPSTVKAGETITIFIDPGKYGANKLLTVHKASSNARKGTTKWCSGSGLCLSGNCNPGFKCYGTMSINYRTSNTWVPGDYYVRIYDYTVDDYITEQFEII